MTYQRSRRGNRRNNNRFARPTRRMRRRRPINNRVKLSMVEVKRYDIFMENTAHSTLPAFVDITGVDDYLVTDQTGSGSGMLCINEIQQGPGSFERIGVKANMTRVRVNMTLRLMGTDGYNSARMLLIHDRAPNGVYPALMDILASNDGGTNTLIFSSPRNDLHTDRFRVIFDRKYDLDVQNKTQISINVSRNSRINTQFATSAGAITDVSTGALYLIVGSSVFSGTLGVDNSIVPIDYNVSVWYRDN